MEIITATLDGKEYNFQWYGKKEKYDFNYVLAFCELAWPAYNKLSKDIKDLVLKVSEIAGEVGQDSKLDMCWPKDNNLKQQFEQFENEELAMAARVIYFLGHWFCKPILCENEETPLFSDVGLKLGCKGAHWKFAHYCDQIIRDRLNISNEGVGRCGLSLHEGMARVFYSTKDMWVWIEVGLPGVDFVEKCIAGCKRVATEEDFYKLVSSLKENNNSFEKEWLDTKKYVGNF
jgi:hypothetical protein